LSPPAPEPHDERIRAALARDRTIDITTTGVRSGRHQRIEIWFHNLDGRLYITGTPGRRGWYANLLANPEFVFHLKQTVRADLPARALAITDASQRLAVFGELLPRLGREDSIDAWAQDSPLVEVEFLEAPRT
jgi:hypothetical protein